MSLPQRNKSFVARYFKGFWPIGNLNIVDELYVEDVVCDYPLHGTRWGRTAIKAWLDEFQEVWNKQRPFHLIIRQLTRLPSVFDFFDQITIRLVRRVWITISFVFGVE